MQEPITAAVVDPSGAESGTPSLRSGKNALQIERADARTRTADPFITSEVLYQLSYVGREPKCSAARSVVPAAGGGFDAWRSAFRGTCLGVTIPDIGHCAGSGAEPAQGSVADGDDGARTGVCPACSGRFALHPSGVMSLHDAAEIEEREATREPSSPDA